MNSVFVPFLALVFVLVSLGQDCHACGGSSGRTSTVRDEHECDNYMPLSDRTRHYMYGGGVENDAHLDGWYRFVGKAGKEMLSSCLTMNKCNTACVGHLVQNHPSRTDRAVDAIVCFSCYNRCCERSISIKVRNCGSFYVYKLKSIPVIARLRYCGEGERN